MKIEYLNCLKSLRNYRKLLKNTNDSKKGKLYFSWLSFKTEKITMEECEKIKRKINTIIQLDNIHMFKKMKRWADITRIRKVSLLRLNFSGTIGKIDGKYIDEISKKISKEF